LTERARFCLCASSPSLPQGEIAQPTWVEMPSVDIVLLEKRVGGAAGALAEIPGRASLEGLGGGIVVGGGGEGSLATHPHWCTCAAARGRGAGLRLAVGAKVAARYRDGNWYGATVGGWEGEGKERRYVMAWDDGDESDTLKASEEVCMDPGGAAVERDLSYRRVCGMTCQEVVDSVANIDGLAQYKSRLQEAGLDGEGMLQLAWLLDPPEIMQSAEAQASAKT
jgi:hypothetical protein